MLNAPVEENVESRVAVRVVNAPAAGAVPPIAGGLARYVLNPVPLTVLDADSVVNAPVPAVVAPTDALSRVPPLIVGLVKVLLVSVSVVARATRVSVDVGNVNVPVLTMVAMTGAVSVLLVRVCVTPIPTRVVLASGIV